MHDTILPELVITVITTLSPNLLLLVYMHMCVPLGFLWHFQDVLCGKCFITSSGDIY
jgi:hypothetical protein